MTREFPQRSVISPFFNELLGVSSLASKISLIRHEMTVFDILFAKNGKRRVTISTLFPFHRCYGVSCVFEAREFHHFLHFSPLSSSPPLSSPLIFSLSSLLFSSPLRGLPFSLLWSFLLCLVLLSSLFSLFCVTASASAASAVAARVAAGRSAGGSCLFLRVVSRVVFSSFLLLFCHSGHC